MKKINLIKFIIVGLMVITGSWVEASGQVLVKKATAQGDFMPPTSADLKPLTSFQIEVLSCKKVVPKEWKVEVNVDRGENNDTSADIEFFSTGIDCMGSTTKQTLTVSTREIPLFSNVRVVNPILIDDLTTH